MNNILLYASEKIVDANGTPTLAFLAKWQNLTERLLAAEAFIANAPNTYVAKEAGTSDWAAATGTATRTTYATGTVTTPQLAERVKALTDDLLLNGAIK